MENNDKHLDVDNSHIMSGKKSHWLKIKKLSYAFSRFLKKINKIIPFKKIGFGLLVFAVIVWSSFHFYFANPSRVESIFTENISNIVSVEETANSIDSLFLSVSLSSDLRIMQQKFQSLVDAEPITSLPPKILVNYAYIRSDNATKYEIDELYNIDTKIFNEEFIAATNGYIGINKIVGELEENKAKLQSDTSNFESYLQDSINTLRQIDNDSIIDTRVLQKIYIIIQDSLLDYKETENVEQFEYRYDNVSSEVIKEFSKAWSDSFTNQLLPKLKIMQTLQESLVNDI